MGRKSSNTRSAVDALELAAEERRNRTRVERDDSHRYYDRLRAELAMQRGMI